MVIVLILSISQKSIAHFTKTDVRDKRFSAIEKKKFITKHKILFTAYRTKPVKQILRN